MDLLVIGIDGASKAIIDSMPMPFTRSLLSCSRSRLLNEDLLSRGWAEILTGEHASKNRAYYQMPMADQSYDFSCSYSKTEMVTAADNEPLWRALNSAGKSVGLMNVPTTGPADKVDGFLVAGGGGGLNVGDGIPADMVYPPAHLAMLRNRDYLQDVRLPGGETTASAFIERIRQAEVVQANAFVDMAQTDKPDFGFFCFRMATEIQYLARYEIQRCAEERRNAHELGEEFQPKGTVQKSLLEYYASLDDQIRHIFERVSPEDYIVTGDHSTVIFEHEANIDVWLEGADYLTRMSTVERKARNAALRARRKVRRLAPKYHQTRRPNRVRRPLTAFHPSKTKAFGTFYDTGNFAGIYINDHSRFGGPVKTREQQDTLVDEICSRFNETPAAEEYGLHALAFRRRYAEATYAHLMPDIEIAKPDTIYFSGRNWRFIKPNAAIGPLSENLHGVRFPHTGVKGRDPLLSFSDNLQNYIKPDDPDDLRTVYRMIRRYFQKAS